MAHSSKNTLEHRLQEFVRYSELKQLAYNIAAMQQEKRFHSLAVLSYFPAEGKTLFCAAIALAYVETCRAKVLVVDTTTLQNKGSLILKDCFNGSAPEVHVTSLEELRRSSHSLEKPAPETRSTKALEGEVLRERPSGIPLQRENDFSLIKKVAEDRGRQYGLILLDTAPLEAKNRSNVDPLLVARLSDASVLVVGRKLLNEPKLSGSLKAMEDPSLHLMGLISNEAHCP